MIDKLKIFLKRLPSLYKLVQAIYWKIGVFRANLLGTKLEEERWHKKSQFVNYSGELHHPHRQFLINRIEHHFPISNILEIGCGRGQNLYLLAKKFPGLTIKGIDINPTVIKFGQKLFSENNIKNVELLEKKADDLSIFTDKMFDVLFTDATLMYIGPDKIMKVIEDIKRITVKSIILVEWHQEGIKGLGKYDSHLGLWHRNYSELLTKIFPKEKINISKIPIKFWPDENWNKFGYIIEINL
jgi:ubiquinone/menaquinone biosynthesis C-methylase UbiE